MTIIYRQDIQCLRGLSVLAVVLFHLQVAGFASGFLGVDIFFVISGFLMALLYDPADKAGFFMRRIRRLLPAYFAIVLAVLTAALLVVTPHEWGSVRTQGFFALTFLPNLGYWLENSYFSKDAFTPLLHLWSLGVEIQFYLILPLLAWFFRVWRPFLLLLAVASLALCFWAVEISPKTAFFITPFRLWEFLAGYAVALYGTARGALMITPARAAAAIGMMAFAGLALAPLLPVDGEAQDYITGHPGLAALGVTILTCAVLAGGLPQHLLDTRMARGLARLGEYSYALYLVHFPVIVLFLYEPFSGTILKPATMAQGTLIIGVIAVLTLVLHHGVENPARARGRRRVWLALPVMALLLAAGGSMLQDLRFSPDERLVARAWYDRAPYRCGKMMRLTDPAAVSCNLTPGMDQPARTILLAGDSHADSIKGAFVDAAMAQNVAVHFIVQNMPLMPGGIGAEALADLAAERRAQTIVLHYSPRAIGADTVRALLAAAEKRGIAVAVIAPVPTWTGSVPRMLWDSLRDGKSLPVQDSADYRAGNRDYFDGIGRFAAPHLRLYETADLLCTPACAMRDAAGNPAYFDSGHMTLSGARMLRPLFDRVIAESAR